MAVPTSELGHAGVQPSWGRPAAYRLPVSPEDVVELTWPLAVKTYDKMRRSDSKVAATLRAMMMPILAADWRINPRQAKPEVTERVSQDLGLPILDAPDVPPVRTRDRFDWRFHLRHALLSRVYGLMPAEQVYRIDADGYARIRKLAVRMPHTLTNDPVKLGRDGGLEAIEQWPLDGFKPVVIPIERLVVYVYDREGYGWLGNSLLRPIYRDFLLKDAFHRIAAVAMDRHGAGVALYTDSPDADGAEAKAGQELAEGYRSGENAGGRIPHGAKLDLKTVEGELPRILDYYRYHDEQIAANTLDMFSTLPSAPNGSRALGETLVNFFTTALNAHALDVATIATNHVVEDLVDINWGPDEPAPAVECGEIGAQQHLTALAIKQLIEAKAIEVDDSLRRYLRRYYRLPTPDGLNEPEPEPEPVAV